MNLKISAYSAIAVFLVIVLIKAFLSSIGLMIKLLVLLAIVYPAWKAYTSIKGAFEQKKRKANYSIDKLKVSTANIEKSLNDW